MANITYPYDHTNHTLADADHVMANFNAIAAQVNGALDGANLANGSVGNAQLADGSVDNAKIAAGAEIAWSKMADLTAAHILLGDASNQPAIVNPAGAVELSSAGATSIQRYNAADSGEAIAAGMVEENIMTISNPAAGTYFVCATGMMRTAVGDNATTFHLLKNSSAYALSGQDLHSTGGNNDLGCSVVGITTANGTDDFHVQIASLWNGTFYWGQHIMIRLA